MVVHCLICLWTFPYQWSSQFTPLIWRCHVSTVCVHFLINATVNSFLSSGDVMSQLSMYISSSMQQSIHSPSSGDVISQLFVYISSSMQQSIHSPSSEDVISQLFVYISSSMQQSIHFSHLEMSCLNCLCTFPYQCSSQFIPLIWRCHVSIVYVHLLINAAVNSFPSHGDVMSQLSMYISSSMQQSIHSPLIWRCHVSIVYVHFLINAAVNSFPSSGNVMSQSVFLHIVACVGFVTVSYFRLQ